jgi:hypothetical protein
LAGRTQRLRVGDYLSETTYLSPLFLNWHVQRAGYFWKCLSWWLEIVHYALTTVDDLDHRVCRVSAIRRKYDLNAGKCKSISFSPGWKPVLSYVIGDNDLNRVRWQDDFCESHSGLIVSKSARILPFIMRISKEFNDRCKKFYVSLNTICIVCVFVSSREAYSARMKRTQNNFIRLLV